MVSMDFEGQQGYVAMKPKETAATVAKRTMADFFAEEHRIFHSGTSVTEGAAMESLQDLTLGCSIELPQTGGGVHKTNTFRSPKAPPWHKGEVTMRREGVDAG
jgi:hypothetical protein